MLAFRRLEASGLKVVRACQFRGSKSRNKVSVGEPAEGSNFVFADKNISRYICVLQCEPVRRRQDDQYAHLLSPVALHGTIVRRRQRACTYQRGAHCIFIYANPFLAIEKKTN